MLAPFIRVRFAEDQILSPADRRQWAAMERRAAGIGLNVDGEARELHGNSDRLLRLLALLRAAR